MSSARSRITIPLPLSAGLTTMSCWQLNARRALRLSLVMVWLAGLVRLKSNGRVQMFLALYTRGPMVFGDETIFVDTLVPLKEHTPENVVLAHYRGPLGANSVYIHRHTYTI